MNIRYFSLRNRFSRDDKIKCHQYLFSCLGNVVVGSMITVARCIAMPHQDIENHLTMEFPCGNVTSCKIEIICSIFQENLDINWGKLQNIYSSNKIC